MKILASEGVAGLLSEILEIKDLLFKGEIAVTASGSLFRGQLVEKTNKFLVLKSPSEFKVASGPNAGKKLDVRTFVSVESIEAISVVLPSED